MDVDERCSAIEIVKCVCCINLKDGLTRWGVKYGCHRMYGSLTP